MAETTFPPSAAVAQPVINKTGNGWANDGLVADRQDATANLPLTNPAAPEAPSTPPPAPAPPVLTEGEKRERLAEAIAARSATSAAMQRAEEAHTRAVLHHDHCQKVMESFADLEAAVDAHVLTNIRVDGDAELSPELRSRMAARELAHRAVVAAARAVKALTVELDQATDAHRRAEWPQSEALAALIDSAKEPLREELRRVELKAAALQQALERGPHAAPWLLVAAALVADPMTATLDVVVPDAPLPSPPSPPRPVYVFRDEVVMADSGEVVTMAESARRARAAREAAAEPIGAREERARQQAALPGYIRRVGQP
jgi:hypothetical protein